MFILIKPDLEHLPSYVGALKKDWSPNNLRTAEEAREHLAKIEEDVAAFVDNLDDPEAKAGPVILPDGSQVQRLPGYARWMWDGEFCGAIGFRWKPGTTELPPTCLGHIGYSVVPWKRGRGYAKQALGLLLQQIDIPGLDFIDITADTSNIASHKVITGNNGVFIERFTAPASLGGKETLRYRIHLPVGKSNRPDAQLVSPIARKTAE